MQLDYKIMYVTKRENLYRTRFDIPSLAYGSSGKHLARTVKCHFHSLLRIYLFLDPDYTLGNYMRIQN